MAVGFSQIPNDVRIPFMHIEIDDSQSGVAVNEVQPALILGHMWTAAHSEVSANRATAGTASLNTLYPVRDGAEAALFFGPGSMLHQEVLRFRAVNPYGELYCCAVAEDGAATQATWTLTFGGSATEDGTNSLDIDGHLIETAVATGDAAADVAAAVTADVLAYNAANLIGMWADATTVVVTIASQVKGVVGSSHDVKLNAGGAAKGQKTPAGLTAALVAATAGTTWPTMTSAVAAMADEPFDVIVVPWWDTTVLDALKAEVDSRWVWDRALDGHIIGVNPVTNYDAVGAVFGGEGSAYAQLLAFGAARNSAHETLPGTYDVPGTAWAWAAQWGGLAARYLGEDPAAPLQTLACPDLGPPPRGSDGRWTATERNNLLKSGVATYTIVSGVVHIERSITTYQLNGAGVADVTWLDITTPFTAMRIKRGLKTGFATKYPRAKLVSDDEPIPPVQGAVPRVPPKLARAEFLRMYREFQALGWVEDYDAFEAGLVVERSATDRNRLNVLFPPDFANQLRVLGVLMQPRL